MKSKNRISMVVTSSILSAVLGAAMGSILTIYTDKTIKDIPVDPLHIVIFFSILVTALSSIIFFRVETVDEYRYEMTKDLISGFISIDKESISEFAIALVKKASFIRVVGTARQDVIEGEKQRVGKRYLKCLEEKMNRKYTNESDKFSYFRVVPKTLKLPLKDHIRICTENSKKTQNVFLYKEVQPFAFYLSYQLFDDTDMLLIVDKRSHTGASDNALCFWTRNTAIIKAFTEHFDDAWGERRESVGNLRKPKSSISQFWSFLKTIVVTKSRPAR